MAEPTPISKLRAAAASIYLERQQLARLANMTFAGARDMSVVLGRADRISTQDYRERYSRGGIARRVVNSLPKATWRGGAELIEDQDPNVSTEFEQAWDILADRLKVWSMFYRVDVLSSLSTYAVILIGADGDLAAPLTRATGQDKILYLSPFAGAVGNSVGADARVLTYVTNTADKRFGLPETYTLRRTDFTAPEFQKPVHWTRVIHVAEECLDDEISGAPGMEAVWDYLDDLDKVVGGGSEAFWLRANQGMHLDVDKDVVTTDEELAAARTQAEEYQHQMRRMIRTRGVNITPLGSDVANFNSPADAILTLIAGTKGIPKRILTGSEMGELASSQDRENWRDQVTGRQTDYAGPAIVRQLVDRLIEYGYLPTPKEYDIRWPGTQALTADERAAGALKWASVNQTQGEKVFSSEEIRDHWYQLEPLEEELVEEPVEEPIEEPVDEDEAFPRAALASDDEMVRVLAAAIEAGNTEVIDRIVGVDRALEFDDDQPRDDQGQWTDGGGSNDSPSTDKATTSPLGARIGKKGDNFVKKALEPRSYGSHYKNINDPAVATELFEQTHAALEKQGWQRTDAPHSLAFAYQREANFTNSDGRVARLRKDFFSADPVAKAKGYKGTSRVRLDIKAKP